LIIQAPEAMSYDIILRAKQPLRAADVAAFHEQFRSIAHRLDGELFMTPREGWESGERIATLCLPWAFASAETPAEIGNELIELAKQTGLELFDPQTGTEIEAGGLEP
jgi:hypothetical protein